MLSTPIHPHTSSHMDYIHLITRARALSLSLSVSLFVHLCTFHHRHTSPHINKTCTCKRTLRVFKESHSRPNGW